MVLLSECERGASVISRAREVVVLSESERWFCYQSVREVVVLSESERGGCVIRE